MPKLERQRATENERQAQLQVELAQRNLENARKTDTSTASQTDASIASAEAAVSSAELSLNDAEQRLLELQQTLTEQEQNLLQNEENTLASAMTTFRRVLQEADSILGATPRNPRENDEFEVYLGFRNPQTRITSQNLLRELWSRFVDFEEDYYNNTSDVTSDEFQAYATEIRDLLQTVDSMLRESTTGANFTQARLDGFRTSTSTNRTSVEQVIQSITATDQQTDNFVVERPQRIRAAEQAISQAEKQLVQAQRQLEQAQSGGEVSDVNTDNQISSAQNALESAQASLEITRKQNEIAIQQSLSAVDNARNALNRANVQFSKLGITSPINGVVLETRTEVGDTVSPGAPLFTIGQIDNLILESDVSSSLLPKLRTGMRAIAEVDGYGGLPGTVTKISPIANQATRRVAIEITIENRGREIPANIFAAATLILKPDVGIIMIPQKALVSQNPAAVFVIGEGEAGDQLIPMAERREVSLGRKQDGMIEVIMGLEAGEQIVAEPVLGLKNGDRVEIRTEEEPETEIDDEAETEEGDIEEEFDAEDEEMVEESEEENNEEEIEQETTSEDAEAEIEIRPIPDFGIDQPQDESEVNEEETDSQIDSNPESDRVAPVV